MNRKDIETLTNNNFEFIQYCINNGFLKNHFICNLCHREKNLGVFKTNSDRFVWKCPSKKCSKSNNSIRKNSVFNEFKLSLKKIFFLIYEFSVKTSAEAIIKEMKISNVTVTKYLKFFRLLIKNYYFCFENNRKIGGINKIVEIDECCLFRRKYNVGRIMEQVWIFGGIERKQNGKAFFEKVNNRKATTLKEVLLRRVNPETVIISDSWKAYKNLEEMNFIHFKINHSKKFVDPLCSEIHIQKIKSTWNLLRRLFK